jgi:hypothetical protein
MCIGGTRPQQEAFGRAVSRRQANLVTARNGSRSTCRSSKPRMRASRISSLVPGETVPTTRPGCRARAPWTHGPRAFERAERGSSKKFWSLLGSDVALKVLPELFVEPGVKLASVSGTCVVSSIGYLGSGDCWRRAARRLVRRHEAGVHRCPAFMGRRAERPLKRSRRLLVSSLESTTGLAIVYYAFDVLTVGRESLLLESLETVDALAGPDVRQPTDC